MEVNAGSSLVASMANFSNFGGNTLTGGTYVVNGSATQAGHLSLNVGSGGGEIVNNAANIVLNGPAFNTLFEDLGGQNALSNLAANSTADSSLTIEGGFHFITSGDFTNAGTVTIGGASSLDLGPSEVRYTQTGGNTCGSRPAATSTRLRSTFRVARSRGPLRHARPNGPGEHRHRGVAGRHGANHWRSNQ